MEPLDYLDRLTYELGYKADGSGVLQNELISRMVDMSEGKTLTITYRK